MRAYVIILFLAAISSIHGDDGFSTIRRGNEINPKLDLNFNKKLKNSVQCIQDLLKGGKADIGLPAFDPFRLDVVEIDLSRLKIPFLKGTLSLNNFVAAGFVNWDNTVAKLNLVVTNLQLTLEWPSTSIEGTYDINASFLGIPITGSGAITGSSNLGIIEIHVTRSLVGLIDSISLKPSLSSADLSVEKFFVGGNDKTSELNESFDIIIQWIVDNLEVIGENLGKYLLQAISTSYASTYSLSEILNAMVGCIKIL